MKAVFYNGIFTDYDTLKIPLTDRSVFFGDGVYDVAIGHGGKLFMGEEHLSRFFTNISKIGLLPYCNEAELKRVIKVLLSGEKGDYILYMQSSGFSNDRTHSRKEKRGNLLLCVFPFSPVTEFSSITTRTVLDNRSNICDIKSLNLLPAVLASTRGEELGFEENVFVRDGFVTECSHSSIAIVKDGVLYTHPISSCILPSITRLKALQICKELGIRYEEVRFTKEQLYSADEVLILSTTKFCRWVSRLDNVEFDVNKAKIGRLICEKLIKNYKNI